VITKLIFNNFNSNFFVENVGQKLIFTQKLTTNHNFQKPLAFLSRNGTHRIVGYQRHWRIDAAFNNQSKDGILGDRKWS